MKCECWTTIGTEEISLHLSYDPDTLTLYVLNEYGIDEELEQYISLGYGDNSNYVYNFSKYTGNIIRYSIKAGKKSVKSDPILKWTNVRNIISESNIYKVTYYGLLYNAKRKESILLPYNEDETLIMHTVAYHGMANYFDKAKKVIYEPSPDIEISNGNAPASIFTMFPNCEILRIPNSRKYPHYLWKICFPKLKKLIFDGRWGTDDSKIREDAKTAGFDENSNLEIIKEFYIDAEGKPIKENEE